MPPLPIGIHGTAEAHSVAEPRGSAGWPSIRLPGQKEGEVGGKLSAGRSPLRSLEPHCGSPASPRPSRRRVSLLATVPIRGTSFDAARVALVPNPAQGESGGLLIQPASTTRPDTLHSKSCQ